MITPYLAQAKAGAKALKRMPAHRIDEILQAIASTLANHVAEILEANEQDLSVFPKDDPRYDRLKLTQERILDMAKGMKDVSFLASPLQVVMQEWTAPQGLQIQKVTQPFGVIGVIYEARPNVSCDVFSLCFKAGSAVILKGGKEAHHTNEALVKLIQQELKDQGEDPQVVTLLPPDRAYTEALLQAVGQVDLVIPRGSRALIDYVRNTARVPVIETGAGICHTYFSASGNTEMGAKIIHNAKCRRVSVCNALDTLLIDEDRLADLPVLCQPLATHQVKIYADQPSLSQLKGHYPDDLLEEATEAHYGMEFLDYKMSIKSVPDIEAALAHIEQYSSKHSEAIIAQGLEEQQIFQQNVDAACVYVNASTAFTDGGEFGFGAEIGISTQKLHARGPMGLHEITTYKYQVLGSGNVR